MKYIIYSLYKYYDKGSNKEIAYEKTILVILLFVLMNIFTILILLNSLYLLDSLKDKSRVVKYIIFAVLYFAPGYYILSKIMPKAEIQDETLVKNYKSTHGLIMIAYMVLSVLFLVIAIIKKM
ncbi:hypothetical protein FMM05_20175 [Flavobacterium zepuense]|uniref:Uncharacterized protein n=1 Tax=Flavobacterium zepuense TaxID=2593302 RepID=A0A552UTJ8_9FLAO|nr:hypothetical protein [Flavobacterium zepuense]TRW21470.1 hypothetical protein FMM05_20175 [Flavobacterium zepuense]